MMRAAVAGAPEGDWLVAERQTAGRGRLLRAWASPSGNLHASTIVRLRPTDPPAATLALVAGVALHEAVAAHAAGAAVTLKWPNDLLLDGAKLAGILLERTGDAVVAGFGVNLADAPALPDRRTARIDTRPDALAETLADALARWLGLWRSAGLAPVRARWAAHAHPPGTALRVALPGGDVVDGVYEGLDADCALRLQTAGGRMLIHAGDVFLI